MAHATLLPGTRVRCTYRDTFRHVGTLLADDDPRGWVGSMAFPRSTAENPPTIEDVRAHMARTAEGWPGGAAAYRAYMATRAVVAWDFGRVDFERASAIFAAQLATRLTDTVSGECPCGCGEAAFPYAVEGLDG